MNFIRKFACVGDAARAVNGFDTAIINVCKKKGRHKSAYNYIWEYTN